MEWLRKNALPLSKKKFDLIKKYIMNAGGRQNV